QTIGVSAFNEPMRLALSMSHSEFASAFMLGTLLGALPLTMLGGWADRHGLKKGILAGLAGIAVACVVAATARGWFAVFIAFWLLRMLGGGFPGLMSANTLAFWFDRKLGLAERLRQVGFACRIAVMPAITLVLIHHFGWRLTWMGFSLAVALGFAPLIACFYRNRTLEEGPADGGTVDYSSRSNSGLTPAQARKTAAYWGLIGLSVW